MDEIPEMKTNNSEKTSPAKNPEKIQKEIEKAKKELDKLKNFIVKKYSFIQSISIIPPQAIKLFIEENEIPKETEKHTHLCIIIPEEKTKEKPKILQEIIKQIEKTKQKIWVQIKTPVEIWEHCFDSKFSIMGAISMSFPLHDQGILSALRVAEIHKSLVLQKFEKYVVSYVIAGSVVRGDVVKESDVDAFVIINDTDVKRMSRLELKERLKSIIHQYIPEATALAGLKKNLLNIQVYLLTDFWESVKDANPVMFTFIRDGVPIYDRGTFMPWKALLRMGKLKPSPEAIDMFMSMGDKTITRAKKALLDIVVHEIYWSILTPSQALLMLYGLPPPTPKQVVKEMEKTFTQKEKMLEKKYINILRNIVQIYKDYEHEKIKEIKGAEIDKLLKDTESYLKRLKDLREQIEKRAQEKTIEQIYKDTLSLLHSILGRKSTSAILYDFENQLVKQGKFTKQHLRILKNIFDARAKFKKGKLSPHKIDTARKEASLLTNDLIEYAQRRDLIKIEKGKIVLRYGKDEIAEILTADKKTFLIKGQVIKKITDKIEDSSIDEVSKALENQQPQEIIELDPKIFELVKKEIGKFEIIL